MPLFTKTTDITNLDLAEYEPTITGQIFLDFMDLAEYNKTILSRSPSRSLQMFKKIIGRKKETKVLGRFLVSKERVEGKRRANRFII